VSFFLLLAWGEFCCSSRGFRVLVEFLAVWLFLMLATGCRSGVWYIAPSLFHCSGKCYHQNSLITLCFFIPICKAEFQKMRI
jgi:hypothetical protein